MASIVLLVLGGYKEYSIFSTSRSSQSAVCSQPIFLVLLPTTGPSSAHLSHSQHAVFQSAQIARYFPNTPCFLIPLQYSFFCPDTHLPSLLSSHISTSSRLNSNATFSGKFPLTACVESVPLFFVSLASSAYHLSRCIINRFLLDCKSPVL